MNPIPGKARHLFWLVVLVSLSLRLELALVNREANDPHLPVVDAILKTDRLPLRDDCWECFQPKLFHVTVARVLQGLGLEGASEE